MYNLDYIDKEGNFMTKTKKKRKMSLLGVFLICLCLTSVNVLAASKQVYLMGAKTTASDTQRNNWLSSAKISWNSLWGISTNVKTYKNWTNSNLLSYMKSADYMLLLSHGNQTVISCYVPSTPEYSKSTVSVNNNKNLSSNALSKMKIFASMACSNGKGGGTGYNNIVNAIYNKGAKVSIGSKVTTWNPQAGHWLQSFSILLQEGNTIYDSMRQADSLVLLYDDSYGGVNQRHVRGNTSKTLYN